MKFLPLCLLLAFTTTAYSVEISVSGPCDSMPLYQNSFVGDLNQSLGKISVDNFEKNKVPYLGNENGMHSILGMPYGDAAIEILSNTKMRAYGLCFTVNGEIPEALSSEVYLSKQSDKIHWFYAFSTYDQGLWVDYCVPANTVKSHQFCD